VVEYVRGQCPRGVQFLPVGSASRRLWSSSFGAEVVLSSSAAVTALEQSRGYYVAISSVGAQVRNPGTSDASMSKHVVNRLIEFIVLGSFCSFAWVHTA
jgi:NAD(P)-dependent dehydrogenase (short-subunit alcohol dehydrogenase family)